MQRWRYFCNRLQFTRLRWAARRRRLTKLWRTPGAEWPQTYGAKWLNVLFAALDLIGVVDVYEATINSLSPSIRALHPRERQMLLPIFGEAFPYHLIRVDERAWVGPRFYNFCYVSFHTINSWGPMQDATLVHEVVHVWQYLRYGAAYIPRALHAQRTPEGYNYGGLAPLRAARGLEDFNYEQQADIIEDAYRIANFQAAQWVPGRGPEVLDYYLPYLRQILSSRP